MIHFAYPNARERERQFIGCGRYIALPPEKVASIRDYDLAAPRVTSLTAKVYSAVAHLAPESSASPRKIYERKDQPAEKYFGNSQNLAYLLALINRSRRLKFTDFQGDIWCTGSIELLNGATPFLNAVFASGFDVKLLAFLAATNQDRLFLTPEINAQAIDAHLLNSLSVDLISLSELPSLIFHKDLTRKTLVAIAGHELEDLVEILFSKPVSLPHNPDPGPNPYCGLFAFQEHDAPFFFGREAAIEQLTHAIHQNPLVIMTGASGCGKSSLVNAGVLPRLRQEQETQPWLIAAFRPGEEPYQTFAAALLPFFDPEDRDAERLHAITTLTKDLSAGNQRMKEVVATLHGLHPERHILLCIDQAEELYTLCRDEQARRQVLDIFVANQPEQRDWLHILFIVRADFLGKILKYRLLADSFQQAGFFLGMMNRQELRAAITQPALTCGVQIEDGLVERILEAVWEEPGALPLLEFALSKLWETQRYRTLTHASYNDIGGVEHALAFYAEQVYDQLTSEEQRQVQRIFTQLVRPGEGTEDTRRVATRTEIGPEQWKIVVKLADARLVITSTRSAYGKLPSPFGRGAGGEKNLPSSFGRGAGGEGSEAAQPPDSPPGRGQGWVAVGGKVLTSRTHPCPSQEGILHSLVSSVRGIRGEIPASEDTVELVHEALISGWQRLHEWIERDREFRIWQERLRVALQQWYASRKDRGALLRGVVLTQAEHWLHYRPEDLSQPEQYFIQAALELRCHEQREQEARHQHELDMARQLAAEQQRRADEQTRTTRKLRTRLSITIFLAFVAIVAALLAFYEFHQARRQADFARTQALLAKTSAETARSNERIAFQQRTIARREREQAEMRAIELLNQSSKLHFLLHDELESLVQAIKAAFLSRQKDLTSTSLSNPVTTSLSKRATPLQHQILCTLREIVDGVVEKNRLETHELAVKSVQFSPDGALLASASQDTTIKLWRVSDGKELNTLTGHTGAVQSVSFSPDGRLLASGGSDAAITLWDLSTNRELVTYNGHNAPVWSVAFSPDGKLLASGSADGTIKLWNVAEHSVTAARQAHRSPPELVEGELVEGELVEGELVEGGRSVSLSSRSNHGEIRSVTFSPDGELLASGSADGTMTLWSIPEGQELQTFGRHAGGLWSVDFSPDGSLLASGGEDRLIKVWNLAQGRDIATLHGHTDAVRSVTFDPEGKFLISGSDEFDCSIKIWDVQQQREIRTLRGHYNSVVSVNVHPNDTLLASGSDDHTIKLWNLAGRNDEMILRTHAEAVKSLRFSPDGNWLASGSSEGTVALWDVTTRRRVYNFQDHAAPVRSLAFSPDGKFLAFEGRNHAIILWNMAERKTPLILRGHTDVIRELAFNVNGSLLASASDDHTLKLWKSADGSELATLGDPPGLFQFSRLDPGNIPFSSFFPGYETMIRSLAFSPDGTLLVSGNEDSSMMLWDVLSRQALTALRGHVGPVRSVTFSPDGTLLASGSGDNMIKLWNVADGNEVMTLKGHARTLLAVVFSPDGALLASGSDDHTIKIWEVVDGREISTFHGHSQGVNSLAFHPNGKLLASASDDGAIRLWNLDLEDLLRQGCAWLQGYLKNNPGINNEDRGLCDSVLAGM